MKMKYAGVANVGEEEKAQLEMEVKTRARTRAEANVLFSETNQARAQAQRSLKGLFHQTPGAETSSMSPQLSPDFKPAKLDEFSKNRPPPSKLVTASVTANVDAFFEKLSEARKTEAQRRYPELLKASAAPGGRGTFPTPATSKKARGTPTQSSLSGGAA